MRVIDAVGVDDQGRVAAVRWFRAQPSNEVISQHEVVPTIQVVDALMKGEKVTTIFYVEGHRIAGPNVQPTVDSTGHEWIEAISNGVDARTLLDLPRL